MVAALIGVTGCVQDYDQQEEAYDSAASGWDGDRVGSADVAAPVAPGTDGSLPASEGASPDSEVQEPDGLEADVGLPDASDPDASDPHASELDASEPDIGASDAAAPFMELDASEPDVAESDAAPARDADPPDAGESDAFVAQDAAAPVAMCVADPHPGSLEPVVHGCSCVPLEPPVVLVPAVDADAIAVERDAAGRLTLVTYPCVNSEPASVEFAYDADGRLVRYSWGPGWCQRRNGPGLRTQWAYAYDQHGQLVCEGDPFSDEVSALGCEGIAYSWYDDGRYRGSRERVEVEEQLFLDDGAFAGIRWTSNEGAYLELEAAGGCDVDVVGRCTRRWRGSVEGGNTVVQTGAGTELQYSGDWVIGVHRYDYRSRFSAGDGDTWSSYDTTLIERDDSGRITRRLSATDETRIRGDCDGDRIASMPSFAWIERVCNCELSRCVADDLRRTYLNDAPISTERWDIRSGELIDVACHTDDCDAFCAEVVAP